MKKLFYLIVLFSTIVLCQGSEQSIYFGALVKEIPKDIKYIFPKVSLPPSYSLPITSVKDQLNCGSCTAFASLSAFESYLLIKNYETGNCFDLAEQTITSFLINCSDGQFIDNIANYLKEDMGVPEEWCDPYQAKDTGYYYCSNESSMMYKIANWTWIDNTIENLKQAIYQNKPVVVTFAVYDDFIGKCSSGVYTRGFDAKFLGLHAVELFAYQDSGDPGGGYFKIKNSWGNLCPIVRIAYNQVDPINGIDFGGNAIVYNIKPEYPRHFNISGNLLDKFNLPVKGADVYVKYYSSLRGKYYNTNISNSDTKGNYYNTCIQNNLVYTIDPTGCMHFTPETAEVLINSSDVQNINFSNGRGEYHYFIDGHVRCEGGIGSPDVRIYINNILADTTEGENGFYKITSLCKGNYSLKPYKDGCTFEPSTMDVYIDDDKYDKDFIIFYSINGTVYKSNGEPLEDAKIKIIENGKTTTTDINGNYTITGLNCGNYTVEASKEGYVFIPSQKQVSISTNAIFNLDFNESPKYSISGKVFFNGNELICKKGGKENVLILVNGEERFKTSSDGSYQINDLFPGTYKI